MWVERSRSGSCHRKDMMDMFLTIPLLALCIAMYHSHVIQSTLVLWQGAAATVAVKDAPAIFVRNKVEISIDYVMRSPRMASRFRRY